MNILNYKYKTNTGATVSLDKLSEILKGEE